MRNAIVTGAGSGIGRAIAHRLAKDGYAVVVNDMRVEAAEAVAQEIGKAGGEAKSIGGDVSIEADVAALAKCCSKSFGDCTHLINNAGFVHQAKFVDLTPADFDRMFAVHVRGTFLCTRAVLPAMLNAKTGVIVNIADKPEHKESKHWKMMREKYEGKLQGEGNERGDTRSCTHQNS